MTFQIAIDGPVAAGKSTVAKQVARDLGFTYIDTGAMYRAIALAALRAKVDWNDEKALADLAKNSKLRLAKPIGDKRDGRIVTVYLDDEDVSWLIRTSEIAEGASVVSQYPRVRKVLVRLQQELSQDRDVVMEGRDIGTVVLPKANLKIYLSADLGERVKRKRAQLMDHGEKQTYAKVKEDIVTRDTREKTRSTHPLKPAKGAWIFDTTEFSLEEVINKIIERVKLKKGA